MFFNSRWDLHYSILSRKNERAIIGGTSVHFICNIYTVLKGIFRFYFDLSPIFFIFLSFPSNPFLHFLSFPFLSLFPSLLFSSLLFSSLSPSLPFFQIIVSPLAFLFGYYSLATPGGSFVDYWLFTLLLYLSVMGMANFITVLVPGKSKGLVANGIIVILWAFGGEIFLHYTLLWILSYCSVLYCTLR